MIGIIVAMNTELEAIRALLENEKETPYYAQKYYSGIISGKEVTMVEGGIGKVAAAITCTRLIEKFHCDTIINIGTAGGIKEFENVLDMVVVDRMTYHDWISETINNVTSSFENSEYVFYSDEKLVEKARETMSQLDNHNVFIGNIVSGDAFISMDDQVKYIQEHFPEAIACDMESASVGHVCTSYNVPFVIMRSLSDIVIKKDNDLDFVAYVGKASARAADFTREFLKRL